jgi:hypothetical protein
MSYEDKFKRVKERILKEVISIVKEWYQGGYFEFEIADPHPVWEMYIDEFNKEFGLLVTQNVKDSLFMAGKALGFAVQAHQNTTPTFNVTKLVKFVQTFVEFQFDDFNNWCDEISNAMYEQSSDNEDEVISKVNYDPK